jgi:hypothetical protein
MNLVYLLVAAGGFALVLGALAPIVALVEQWERNR